MGFLSLVKSFAYFTSDTVSVDPWATASSPDELIAAHIIQSFATEFDKWSHTGILSSYGKVPSGFGSKDKWVDNPDPRYNDWWQTVTLITIKKEDNSVLIQAGVRKAPRDRDHMKPFIWHEVTPSVNGLPIEPKVLRKIVTEYIKLKKAYETAQRVAAEEKARMEANEKKWNLAEQLLGMKRNGQGALVPAYLVEPIDT